MGRTYRIRKRDKARSCEVQQSWLDNDHSYISLLKWMRKYGYRHQAKLRPACFEETGRGLKACKAVLPGDLIVAIPEKLMITRRSVLEESYLGTINERWNLSTVELLVLFLVCEKRLGSFSKWQHYINVLPPEFTNIAYFAEEDVQHLPSHAHSCASDVKTKLLQTCDKLSKIYRKENLESKCRSFHTCSNRKASEITRRSSDLSDDFLWAYSAVNTRAVYFDSNIDEGDSEQNVALAPYLDFLNHSSSASVMVGFNSVSKCYEIQTLKGYRKYDEVFIKYGNHDNTMLMIEYGFTLRDNPEENIPLSLDELVSVAVKYQDEGRSRMNEKIKIISENGFNKGLNCSSDGLSWALLTSLTILLLPEEEIYKWKLLISGRSISKKHDSQTKLAAKDLISEKLKEYLHLEAIAPDTYFKQMIRQIRDDHQAMLRNVTDSFAIT